MPGKLFTESGGTPDQRAEEALRLMALLQNFSDEEVHDLPEKDQEFLTDMRGRLERYKLRTAVSPQQLFWLRDIHQKLLEM